MKKHAFRHFTSIILFAALSFTFGCGEDSENAVVDNSPIPSPIVPTVVTAEPDSVEFFIAKSGGKITSDGGSPILYFGVCWSTTPNPTIELSTKTRKDTNLTGTYEFKHYPVFTKSQTKYYIRAYAVNKAGVAYGPNTTTIITKPTSMVDKSGFVYFTNLIGNQVWSRQNLRVSTFSNDSSGNQVSIRVLPSTNSSIINQAEWSSAVASLACVYDDRNNTSPNYNFYGLLYNQYAVTNSLNVCPTGWHVPSLAEWDTLIKNTGMIDMAGKNLKGQAINKGIYSDVWNTKPNPRDNFSALPGGQRNDNGVFSNGPTGGGFGGTDGTYWTSTSIDENTAYSYTFKDNDSKIYLNQSNKKNGHSVRCVWNGDPL